jgi:dienelactone hydrolase
MLMSRPRVLILFTVTTALARLSAQEVEATSPPEKSLHLSRPSPSAPVPTVRYIEREFYLPAPMARPRGLDALEVRADLPGRHPLALLTHGTSSKPIEVAEVTPWKFLSQALWFARRGYVALVVVRRGYGRSGGELDGRQGGCGNQGSFTAAGEAGADDLRAAAQYATTLPEVDAGTVISTGISSGGLAQVALSAHPMPGLKAAISFAGGRGGDGKGHNCNLDGLVSAFRGFGKHNKVPMLWIYAENDKWFPPEMARRFDEAFRKGGGTHELVMAPPDGEDGHNLYSHVAKWSPTVEEYLHKQGLLPLENEVLPPPSALNVPEPSGLTDRGAAAFRQFLINGPFKAFATNGAGAWGSSTGQFTQEIADGEAVEHCKHAFNGSDTCKVVERGTQ